MEKYRISPKLKSTQKKTAASLNTDRQKNESSLTETHTCPLCSTPVKELEQEAQDVRDALTSLESEISAMVNFARYDAEQLELLRNQRIKLQQEIIRNRAELKSLQEHNERIKKSKNKQESITYLKANIEIIADQIARKITINDYGDKELRQELRILKAKIDQYNFEDDIYQSEKNLETWMSSMCNRLDFESDFLPAKLSMKLSELAVYHHDKRHGRVSLSDMGSGANWLAFHLSASLGMLRLFSQSEKSVVPTFLFLDQPSQVYFPQNFDEHDNDKKNVEKVYIEIIKELEAIKSDTGFEPQVIVLDHASGLDLKDFKFIDYVREDWHKVGDALI